MEEQWKSIKGYEDSYEVSNFGRIKSKTRIILMKNDKLHYVKEKILKQTKNKKNNYFQVMLVKNNKYKLCYVHRLVAMAFIPNPENFLMVTHINEDDNDNRAENLRWIGKLTRKNKK